MTDSDLFDKQLLHQPECRITIVLFIIPTLRALSRAQQSPRVPYQ